MSRQNAQPDRFGRYLLVEKLAVGGMAEIFKAKCIGAHGFEKDCVIKRILPELARDASEEFVRRFIAEAKLMVRLNHPKVVQVFDFGDVDGQYYIALEYVEGQDASRLLQRCARLHRRPTTGIAVHIVAEVLDALAYAHTLTDAQGKPLGITHRDISPSNIFISNSGQVKLGDFGIAKVAAWHEHTDPGAVVGKYGYLAPEGISGSREVDCRADIFSVGIVLAEMLMVRRLFVAANPLDVLLLVRDADLTRLNRFGKDIDPELRHILDAALARNPAMRFQDAASFRDSLHRYLFDHRLMVRSTEVHRLVARLDEAEREQLHRSSAAAALADSADSADSAEAEDTVQLDRAQGLPLDNDQARTVPLDTVDITLNLRPRVPLSGGAPPVLPGKGRRRSVVLAPPPRPEPLPVGPSEAAGASSVPAFDPLAALPGGSENATLTREFQSVSPPLPPLPSQPSMTAVPSASQVAASQVRSSSDRLAPLSAPDRQGDLARESPARLLFELTLTEQTALLVFCRGQVIKEVYLEDGDPEYVSSNVPDELFGQYLVNAGALTAEDLARALALLPQFKGQLGVILVALKLMRPIEVLRHLTVQVRQKLLEVFNWTEGNYSIYRGKTSTHAGAPLGLDGFEIVCAGIQKMSAWALDCRLQPLRERPLAAVHPPRVPLEVFRLGSALQEFWGRLDGRSTLEELLAADADATQRIRLSRMAYLLVETGLATVVGGQ